MQETKSMNKNFMNPGVTKVCADTYEEMNKKSTKKLINKQIWNIFFQK